MVESTHKKQANPDTLLKRTLVVLVLLPVGLVAIYFGGWFYSLLIALILGIAVYEYATLFQTAGFQPAVFVAILGTLSIVIGRTALGLAGAAGLLTAFLLISMTYHLVAYERGRDQAATDFAVTVSGLLYLGWLGSYLVSLRMLPDGLWWVLTALPAVWLADSGAYFIGVQIGKHKMTKRLSPKKSWEGYLGGIPVSILGTVLLVFFLRALGAGESLTPVRGAILALVLSTLSILGDLGESMVKRQVGAKDSSGLLPGHGGVFDRIDSWLWAGVLGYYTVVLLFG
jgi:phosphatidate cytidylyltransferase